MRQKEGDDVAALFGMFDVLMESEDEAFYRMQAVRDAEVVRYQRDVHGVSFIVKPEVSNDADQFPRDM